MTNQMASTEHLVAVDPGLRGVGLAVFDTQTKQLVRACYAKGAASGNGPKAWEAVVLAVSAELKGVSIGDLIMEFPQCYPRASSKVNNDLAQLAAIDGALGEAFTGANPRVVFPAEWKGSLPKEVHHERILRTLSAEEQARICWPSAKKTLGHNVLDAVGLGLFALGRVKRAGRRKTSS